MRIRFNRKIAGGAVIIIALAAIFCILYMVMNAIEEKHDRKNAHSAAERYIGEDTPMTYYNGKWYALRDDIETVLLIGLDKYSGDLSSDDSYANSQQSDFLMLLLIDHDNESYTALHINRDTMAEIRVLGVDGREAGTITGQLALSHTYGSGKSDSCRNTVKAVSGFLYGIDIDHYVSFTMDAVTKLNDLAGGVTVNIMDDFTHINPEMKIGEDYHLTGEDALTYIRARGSLEDSSNLHRMERQRQYLTALQKQAKLQKDNDEDFVKNAANALSPYMLSDCTPVQLSDVANAAADYSYGEIQTIKGEAVHSDEFMEFYADEDALRAQIIDLFYVEDDSES